MWSGRAIAAPRLKTYSPYEQRQGYQACSACEGAQIHGVTCPRPATRPSARLSEPAEPAIHGTSCGIKFLIIDYLHKNPPELCSKVLDAGCGWGITGIWCAKSCVRGGITGRRSPVFPTSMPWQPLTA